MFFTSRWIDDGVSVICFACVLWRYSGRRGGFVWQVWLLVSLLNKILFNFFDRIFFDTWIFFDALLALWSKKSVPSAASGFATTQMATLAGKKVTVLKLKLLEIL